MKSHPTETLETPVKSQLKFTVEETVLRAAQGSYWKNKLIKDDLTMQY